MHSFGLDKMDGRVVVVEAFTDLGDARTWGTALQKYIVSLCAEQWRGHYHVDPVSVTGTPTDVTTELLMAGVEMNAQARGNASRGGAAIDVAGKTALALACMGGLTDVVNVLLEAGAQVDGAYDDCDTPLYLVRENRFGLIQDNEIELALLAAGASGLAVKLIESAAQDDRSKMYAAQESLHLRLQWELDQLHIRGPPQPAVDIARRAGRNIAILGNPLGVGQTKAEHEQLSIHHDQVELQQLQRHSKSLRAAEPLRQDYEANHTQLHLDYARDRRQSFDDHQEDMHNVHKTYNLQYALAAEDVRGPWTQSRKDMYGFDNQPKLAYAAAASALAQTRAATVRPTLGHGFVHRPALGHKSWMC